MAEVHPKAPEPPKDPTRLGYLRLFTGLDLFLVRPADYPEGGPPRGFSCPGLLWLPAGIGLVSLHVSFVPLIIRYFIKGDTRVAPAAIGVAGAMTIFWGGILAALLLFRLRGPRGQQWDRFAADVFRWIPLPGFVTFLGLLLVLSPVIWVLHLARVIP